MTRRGTVSWRIALATGKAHAFMGVSAGRYKGTRGVWSSVCRRQKIETTRLPTMGDGEIDFCANCARYLANLDGLLEAVLRRG